MFQALAPIATVDANLHGIVVERGGAMLFEAYLDGRDKPGGAWFSRAARFDAETPHDIRSISKSITSLLVGVALERGLLNGLDTPVLDFFPEHADLRTPERLRITVEHLLTMTSGLDWAESGSYARLGNSETQMRRARDPDRYVLERDIVAAPGSRWVYNGGGTALLGEVLVRVTKTPLDAFAGEALFSPLGIPKPEWRRDQTSRVTPFGGLRLRPRELAKIGRLVLDQGCWNGVQVVPAAWIEASTRDRVAAGGSLRYGYQWWRGTLRTPHGARDWTAGFGNGGQRLWLVPSLDLVVVVTAGQYNQDGSWRAPLEAFRTIVNALQALSLL